MCTLPSGRLLFAQTGVPTRDTAIADLQHRDSTSVLTLNDRSVVFAYTSRGIDRERARVDSTTAKYADVRMARTVRESVVGAFRGMRFSYDVSDIASADVAGGTVTITFREPRLANGRKVDNTFDFDAADPIAARDFVARLNERLLTAQQRPRSR